jgi:hypothetical protein
MPLFLRVRTEGADAPWIAFDGERIVVGRGRGADLQLPDATVAHHVACEGALAGTYVGGKRLEKGAPYTVRAGDRVRFGRVLVDIGGMDVQAERDAKLAARRLSRALVRQGLIACGDPAKLRLVVTQGPTPGESYDVPSDDCEFIIGRGEHCDFTLDDPSMSREHARVLLRAGVLSVQDAGSRGGLALGREQVAAGRPVLWKNSVHLTVGATQIGYDDPVGAALIALENEPEVVLSAGEEQLFQAAEEDAVAAETSAAQGEDESPEPSVTRGNDGTGQPPTQTRKQRKSPAIAEARDSEASAALRAQSDLGQAPEKVDKSRSGDFTIMLLALLVLAVSALGFYALNQKSR